MKEQIKDIVKSIKRHRELEISTETTNTAIGRSSVLYDGKDKTFWITLQSPSRIELMDFKGNVVPGYGYTSNKPYNPGGDEHSIPRDSTLGAMLIQNHAGKHIYKAPIKKIDFEIYNRSSYIPSITDNEYANSILIHIAGDEESYSFNNLSQVLDLQYSIDKDESELERLEDDDAKNLLIKNIDEKKDLQKQLLSSVSKFIRKYASLRFQPILDPTQDAIRRSEVFNGNLIINGGPGTGKTTSLIQRIKFLISPTVEEIYTLNKNQKDILYNQKTSWIFFSPNELLALFLKETMVKEGLSADSDRVKVWSNHRNELIKSYKLVDPLTKNPFMIYNKSQRGILISNTPKSIKSFFNDFIKYFLNFQKEKITKVTNLNLDLFIWQKTGQSIIKYLQDKQNIKSIDDCIRLFFNLEEQFKPESNNITDGYIKLLKETTAKLIISIKKNEKRTAELKDIFTNWKNSSIDDDEIEEDMELDDFDEEKEEQLDSDFDRELFSKIKTLCRKIALKKFDKNTKLTKKDNVLINCIPEIIEDHTEYNKLGQIAFFKKYFERIISGTTTNIFREIPLIYKKFRRAELQSKNKYYNIKILKDLVGKDKNKRIHPDEQAFLLYFINTICFRFARNFKQQYDTSNHPFIKSYKLNCKPVIGVDEATDFSLLDLLAIGSFGHPYLSSVTLTGDIMQRMTETGITAWEDLIFLDSRYKQKDLKISYRQSPTLLSLAQNIFKKSTNKEATYTSFIKKSNVEPKPLILITEDEEKKLEWVADRIIEIYRAYEGSIPSIAIFLTDENLLDSFATKLGNVDALADVGIFVKSCRNGEVLGDENTVRVFSIDKIKGLEFEAVFFHDLDSLQNKKMPDELLLRYLYVGLSRATFYLGLTLNKELPPNLNFLMDSFNQSTHSW